jgi:hypothetical protein
LSNAISHATAGAGLPVSPAAISTRRSGCGMPANVQAAVADTSSWLRKPAWGNGGEVFIGSLERRR